MYCLMVCYMAKQEIIQKPIVKVIDDLAAQLGPESGLVGAADLARGQSAAPSSGQSG